MCSVAYERSVRIAPHAVEAEDSRLLTSLLHVFGTAEASEDMVEAADGSGLELLRLLRERAGKVTRKESAVVSAAHARVIREGVIGPLGLASFKAFIKKYKAVKRNMPPGGRQGDEAEIGMIDLVALKDTAIRELYATAHTVYGVHRLPCRGREPRSVPLP